MTTTESEIVTTKTTYDGKTVYVHADGSLSGYMHFVKGGRLPTGRLFFYAGNICVYTWEELPDYIRACRKEAKKDQPNHARKPPFKHARYNHMTGYIETWN